jgi:hypothetical protein
MTYRRSPATPPSRAEGLAAHGGGAPHPPRADGGADGGGIALSSFDRLKGIEKSRGFSERPASTREFFRKGNAGQWRSALSKAQVDRIVADHEAQMARFGYLPD